MHASLLVVYTHTFLYIALKKKVYAEEALLSACAYKYVSVAADFHPAKDLFDLIVLNGGTIPRDTIVLDEVNGEENLFSLTLHVKCSCYSVVSSGLLLFPQYETSILALCSTRGCYSLVFAN